MTRTIPGMLAAACRASILSALFFLISISNFSQTEIPPRKFSVLVSATVQESPPQITLSWPGEGDATGYSISRRTLDSGWQHLSNISGGQNSYTDSNAALGTPYEYQIVKSTSAGYTGYGYIRAGIRLPVVDQRGKVILLVENSLAGALGSELDRLQQSLIGDGWMVIRRTVSASDSPQSVKEVIRSVYNSEGGVNALFLFGHIPVPYSGDIAPDGHPNHEGAWPADVYYGDMDGNWTDSSVNTRLAERTANWNIPGDGKFDQSEIPSTLELMVGRVDLSNMTCYANKSPARSEVDLMRQYLNKLHRFRHGELSNNRQAVICDNFSDKGDDPIGGSAWRAFPAFFGAQNIREVPWDGYFPAATSDSYLWSYGSGGGSYYYSSGVGTSDDFALKNVRVVFTMWMGSYFGDWNNESNFIRAALGSGDVLTSSYSGFPQALYFPMGAGETAGFAMRMSQNNGPGGLYPPWGQGTREVHISLHGDPTLRMHPVKPASNLAISTGNGSAQLTWNGSSDSNIQGYHVYRGTSAAGPFTRVTQSPATGTSYTDTPPAGSYTYMVRAIKLEQSGSGTYLNPSQGIFANATVSGSVPTPPSAPSLQVNVISHFRVDVTWNDVAAETGYRLELKNGADGSWTEIQALGPNVVSYSADDLAPATDYYFRVRAFNDAGVSAYSGEVLARTPALPEPTATVRFIEEDVSTGGTWPQQFGEDGYAGAGLASEPPSYLQFSVSGDGEHVWEANTGDERALVVPGPSGERIASTWYGETISVSLNIDSDVPKQLAFYFLDWDRQGRRQRVEVLDAGTGVVLDSRELSNFEEGKYLVYAVSGNIRLQLTSLAGPNALLVGLFGGGPLAGTISDKPLTLEINQLSPTEIGLRLQGDSGTRYIIEGTTNFLHWDEIESGSLVETSKEIVLELNPNVPLQVIRTRNDP